MKERSLRGGRILEKRESKKQDIQSAKLYLMEKGEEYYEKEKHFNAAFVSDDS